MKKFLSPVVISFVGLFSALFSGLALRTGPSIVDHEILQSRQHIFDTSNYGKLQINNGLARTPQMG